jgi:hypothetical protein
MPRPTGRITRIFGFGSMLNLSQRFLGNPFTWDESGFFGRLRHNSVKNNDKFSALFSVDIEKSFAIKQLRCKFL